MSETIESARIQVRDEDERQQLAAALEAANLPTVLLVLAHLTGDDKWLQEPYRPKVGPVLDDNDSGQLSSEIQREIRAAAVEAILAHEAGVPIPGRLEEQRVREMLEVALVDTIPEEYAPLLAEELGQASRDVFLPSPLREGFSVTIIGAGVSGIALAIKLKAQGVPFVILEKNDEIGGTWWENTYPGCGVDTPSHLYSFSFAPNAEWSRFFAKRPEVHAYLNRMVEEYGIRDHVRFGIEVESAEYVSESGTWVVTTRSRAGVSEKFETPVLVSAVGMVNRPSTPRVEGAEIFGGPVMHTAAWQNDVEYAGKTVGVIGTGASAMQLVPTIADDAERVVVFQRSKQWAVPHPNYHRAVPEGVRYLMARVPLYAQWYRLRAFWNFSDRLHSALRIDPTWEKSDVSINEQNERHRQFLVRYIKDQLGDREDLYDACIPDYPPYAKRPLLDNKWFQTVKRDDVDLVTDDVKRITHDGVETVSGDVHNIDVLVWATGFKALQFLWPMEIRGLSGKTLAEQWGHQDARAFLGLTVPDFPNFFILNGPNTNAGHGGSAFLAIEFQVRYLLQALAVVAGGDADSIEIREDVFWKYNDELDAELAECIWAHPGTTNWYRNEAGRVVVSSPWTYLEYWRRTRDFEAADYVLTGATETV